MMGPTQLSILFQPIGNMNRVLSALSVLPKLPAAEQVVAVEAVSQYLESQPFTSRYGVPGVWEEKTWIRNLGQEIPIGQRSKSLDQLVEILTSKERDYQEQFLLDPDFVTASAVTSPLFRAGPVRFFQSERLSEDARLREGEPLFEYPTRWERWRLKRGLFPQFRKALEEYSRQPPVRVSSFSKEPVPGGALMVEGANFEGLALAARLGASHVVLVDHSPHGALTSLLFTTALARARTREEYVARMTGMFRKNVPAASYLDDIPEGFRPAFASQIDQMRSKYPEETKEAEAKMVAASGDAEFLLGNTEYFDYVSRLALSGGLSVLYGQSAMRIGLGGDSLLWQDLSAVLKETGEAGFQNIYLGRTGDRRILLEVIYGPDAQPLYELLRSPLVKRDGRLLFASAIYRQTSGGSAGGGLNYYAPLCRNIPDLLDFYGAFGGIPLHYDRNPNYAPEFSTPYR